MYLCYVDESGTSSIPGNTSHFVLAGLSIPVDRWQYCDKAILAIKKKFDLEDSEIHVAWILRPYLEQNKISNFENLDYSQRRSRVQQLRKTELLRLQKVKPIKHYRQTKKNYRQTEAYIHLSYQQRRDFIKEIAVCVSRWRFARLFAECIDKVYFDPSRRGQTIDEQSFEQVVSRFEHYLQIINRDQPERRCGLLIHDNNPTVAKKHTDLMKQFYKKGTMWTDVKSIIETPLFVDSQLTSMVQIADLCCYSIRRYLENNEDELFDLVFVRADRHRGTVVGVRHCSDPTCRCTICGSRN
ncbi:MAG: DUF3800 domain-containing protein [Dehalococcoidales bacterium]|nr:DUF3800 domain-containing protein [Dehalococcoidales bacterium]